MSARAGAGREGFGFPGGRAGVAPAAAEAGRALAGAAERGRVFAAAAGFFPFEDASSRDWRFTRACRAQAAGASVTRTIFGFYQRPVPLSAELVALLDGLLQADPRRRRARTRT